MLLVYVDREMAETSESDRVYHRIEGGYHDLLADPLAEDVMDKLMAFMKQRVAGQ